jgi:hypothetical protein
MGEFLTNTHTTGAVIQADEHMQNYADAGWQKFISGTSINKRSMIAHSSTVLSTVDDQGDVYISSDGGETWTTPAKNTTMNNDVLLRKCKADSTIAFGVEVDTATAQDSVITIDSGTTWTDCTADPAFTTIIYDVAFSTTALIVIGGDDNVGAKHIVFGAVAAGQVASWTDMTSGPSDKVYALDMFDATTGFAVDSGSKIWKTVNGAVDWTDTGHTVSIIAASTMHCISATEFLISSTAAVFYYDGATVTNMFNLGGSSTIPLGMIELTNGNIVTGFGSSTADRAVTIIAMTTNDGDSWFVKTFAPSSAFTGGLYSAKGRLSEVGSNNFLVGLDLTTFIKVFGGTDNT